MVGIVAALLRLSLIDYVEFKGDEAQVAGTVRDMLETGRLVQTGMITSVGPLNPPLFDYLMAIPLAFTGDPRVATAFVGLANVAAVLVTAALAWRLWRAAGATPMWTAAIPAGLFAVAPWAVVFSRKIWAPELEPLFASACLYCLVRAREGSRRSAWWTAAALAAWLWMCQLHPAALLLAPVFLIAGPALWRQVRPVSLLAGILVGLLPLVPYLRYDAEHGWTNVQGSSHAASQPPSIDGTSLLFAFMDITSLDTLQLEGVPYTHFLRGWRLFSWHSDIATLLTAAALALCAVVCARSLVRGRTPEARRLGGDLLVIQAWFWLPVLLTARHSTPLFQHYFLILFPAPFLLMGFGAAAAAGWIKRDGVSSHRSKLPRPGLAQAAGLSRVIGRPWIAPAGVIASLGFIVVGWLALVLSLYRYLPSGNSVADFGLPLKTTVAIADLARTTGADGQLWLSGGDDIMPMVRYLLRDRRNSPGGSERILPTDALVLPPAGSPAGYVIDDSTRQSATALRAAGAVEVGAVAYPGSQRRAVGLAWRTGATPEALATSLQPLAVRLVNGVQFVGVATSRPTPNSLLIEYVWRVERVGPEVTSADLALYTHVVGGGGVMVAQKDGMPYPSARWEAGETMAAWFTAPLDGVPSGRYELRAGMYARPSIQRVALLDASGAQRDGEFAVGTLVID